jgi:acetyltransferase-like isoleucine patch superfamily enzyme
MGYSGVFVGRGTYGRPEIIGVNREELHIGSFVSISEGVVIVLANHNSSGVSLYPFSNVDWLRGRFAELQNPDKHAVTKGAVVIGNDVWLGRNSIVLAGVHIGDGAVIGAGAVVSRDVPPFAVVVGNPGRVVKFRLSEKQISQITAIGWWDWDSDVLKKRENDFLLPPDEFITKFSIQREST